MSEWDTVINNLTRPHPPPLPTNDLVSHISAQRSPAAAIGMHEYEYASMAVSGYRMR